MRNPTTTQTSKLFYRQLNHKDIYAKIGNMDKAVFHGAMYVPGLDSSVKDLVWRKRFRDEYVLLDAQTFESNRYKALLCYPEDKTMETIPGYSVFATGEFVVSWTINTSWANNDFVVSVDGKTYMSSGGANKDYNPDIPETLKVYSNASSIGSTKYGVIICSYKGNGDSHKNVFVRLGKNEITGYGEIKEVVSIDLPIIDGEYWHVQSGPESNLVIFTHTFDSDGRYIYNTETGNITKFRNIGDSSFTSYDYVCVNNRVLYLYNWSDRSSSTYKYYCTIYEITESGMKLLVTHPFNIHNIIYNNGVYYMYGHHYRLNSGYQDNHLYISSDLRKVTKYILPEYITVKHISGSPTKTIAIANPRLSGTDYQLAGTSPHKVFAFNDNTRIPNNPYMSIRETYATSGYASGYVQIFIDNLLFKESDNNFYYFFGDDDENIFSVDAKWKKYYNIVKEENDRDELQTDIQ